ncbi:adenylate kinase 4, mitochondrial [Condylostylus longicornis]|uniref:adenylate kinase 4, mitochondrial n=1 Tax=Condylostylus longicornis TaxID=2530218 RepID=UPI00244DE409|nr:adenylate kinase 4, mitochondrial [Condylostylus longicornis]
MFTKNMSSKIFRAVILGPPAAGKGTISRRILKKFNCDHVAPGDILRLHIEKNTRLGQQAKRYLQEGKLVPDDLVIKLVSSSINEIGNRSWLLDGFPRTEQQARILQHSDPVEFVINLKVSTQLIIDRAKNRWVHLPSGRAYNIGFNEPKIPFKDDLTGEDLIQREDDKPEVLEKRLDIYWKTMQPVLDFYKNLDIVYDFSGKSTDEIYPKIEKFLTERTICCSKAALNKG